MNEITLRERIMHELELVKNQGQTAIGVTCLAKRVHSPPVRVALICASLVRHGHAIGNASAVGFVELSQEGQRYMDVVRSIS